MRAATGLLAIVLLASACASGLETPAETLARGDQPDSPFGYVAEVAPAGYELCGVSTPSALSFAPDTAASLHVYGNASLDDPYSGPLLGVAMFPAGPLDELSLGATVQVEVDSAAAYLGGLDGLQVAELSSDTGRLLSYRADADRVIQLVVRGDDSIDLVELAGGVAVSTHAATIRPDALSPGFSDLGDLYQLEGRPSFRFALDYQLRDQASRPDQLTLLGLEGDFASMEAFRFRASVSERIDVDGAPGVKAEMGRAGEGAAVVTWLVDEGLVLRLFSFALSTDELLEVASGVTRVDGADWDSLRSQFDPATCQ